MGQSRDDPLITFLQIPCHVIVHVLAHELWRQLRGILHVNFRTNDLENNFLTIDNLTMIYLPPHNPFNSFPIVPSTNRERCNYSRVNHVVLTPIIIYLPSLSIMTLRAVDSLTPSATNKFQFI